MLSAFGTFVVVDDLHVDEELGAFVGLAEGVGQVKFIVAIGGDRLLHVPLKVQIIKPIGV